MKNIEIRNARENNLKNISLKIPKQKITVITGVSGSGKSSLAHDVIFKEAQRLFIESMSNQSRRLIKSYAKVDVDSITGLSPVVLVSQNTNVISASSTVGTLSGIYDYLRLLMARFAASEMDISPWKQQRRLFSFNTQYGACPKCRGVGMEEFVDYKLIIKDENLSLREGALKITLPTGYTVYSQVTIDVLNQVCEAEGFNVDIPWKGLTKENKDIILYGSDKIKIPFGKHSLESRMKWSGITAKPRELGFYRGIIPIMEEILIRDRNANILRFVSSHKCKLCNGSRLNQQALSHYFKEKNIADFSEMDMFEINEFFKNNNFSETNNESYLKIREIILQQSQMLIDLGLGYLQLNRKASSLSSGESQRIRVAKMAQSQLSGLLYIFDEPSVGLHAADQQPLIDLMYKLKAKGNTVLLIEHEHQMIKSADHIIEIGPKAGEYGGEIIYEGSASEFFNKNIPNSLTQQYILNENKAVVSPKVDSLEEEISLNNIDIHNLKNIDVNFKLKALNVVCGVSGSGKSSLIIDGFATDFARESKKYILENSKLPKQIFTIDQKPIGRTPRSNPATYTKVFDKIRALFAKLPESKEKEFKSSHFSFNTKGGRCEHCQGAGYNVIGMHFVGNVEIVCESCNGNRFSDKILQVKYKGKNIKDILDLRIEDAVDFFKDQPQIYKMLAGMNELGLGYITLGQRATSLSGGEAQRIKLASEMIKNAKQSSIYILDEPSTGLHSYDVEVLMLAINKLISNGHTVIIIEHNEAIIKAANHIIELGSGSGKYGGNIVFEGELKDLLKTNSLTAKALKGEIQSKISKLDNNNESAEIELFGVKTNNLKNVDISIEKNKLNVFTGVSGSGKSSMAFDTIFKTGRDAYLETFPTYLRSRMDNSSQADYDSFKGLTASISHQHKKSKATLRSTLGTYSGIYDLYRLLFSRISKDKNKELCQQESGFFSFNKQEGACSHCRGLGEITLPDDDAFIDDKNKAILDGAISKNKIAKFYVDSNGQFYWTLKALAEKLNLNIDIPWNELSAEIKNIILFGDNDNLLDVEWVFKQKTKSGSHSFSGYWKGFSNLINEEYQRKKENNNIKGFDGILKQELCPICEGNRLNGDVLSYEIANVNLSELLKLDVKNSKLLFQKWQTVLSKNELKISEDIFAEINTKLDTLIDLDLSYLQFSRNLNTLSGGEMQRVSLASSLGARMSDITYVFDEPSRALHPKNRKQVLAKIQNLCNDGNTVIAVEHSPEFINNADNVYEFGPAAGKLGGELKLIKKDEKIFAENIIRDKREIDFKNSISIKSAFANNLKNIDLEIPMSVLVGVLGVSGSGKSSLIREVIYKSVNASKAINCNSISGIDSFDNVQYINADFINTPNSSLAIFLKIEDAISKQFAKLPQALQNKRNARYFSKKGPNKCKDCNGSGEITIEMDFISNISEKCPQCNGSGFNAEVLNYKLLGNNIFEMHNKSVSEAYELFIDDKIISERLSLIKEIGLGYLPLSQKVKELSLGEKQRLILASSININANSNTLFLLDEPSKGLSNKDIQALFNIFDTLLSQGHSVIMVEHNTMVIDNCDHIIELGPGGGEDGGIVI